MTRSRKPGWGFPLAFAASCILTCLLVYLGFFSRSSSSSQPNGGANDRVGSIRKPDSRGEHERIELSPEDRNMPVNPTFTTNYGFREELSLNSRMKVLEGVTNFVANARACGLGLYASGSLKTMVRSGVNNVALAKTSNVFFDMIYSNESPPEVVAMDCRGGRDTYDMPIDVNEFTEDASSAHEGALAAWANTNNYPFVWPDEKTDAAVAKFLELEIPGFADRYLLESREQVERGGYKTPFMRYTYAATNCFKDFSNMNRDSVEVTLRMAGPDLAPGPNANIPPAKAVLVNYSDGGVLWRKINRPNFSQFKNH